MGHFGAVGKRKIQARESCFTAALKFESEAQLLMAFERECKQQAQKINLSPLDPLSLW